MTVLPETSLSLASQLPCSRHLSPARFPADGSRNAGCLVPQLCRVDLTRPAICNRENKLPTHVCKVTRWRTRTASILQECAGPVSSLSQPFSEGLQAVQTHFLEIPLTLHEPQAHILCLTTSKRDGHQSVTILVWHSLAIFDILLNRGKGDISLCP